MKAASLLLLTISFIFQIVPLRLALYDVSCSAPHTQPTVSSQRLYIYQCEKISLKIFSQNEDTTASLADKESTDRLISVLESEALDLSDHILRRNQ